MLIIPSFLFPSHISPSNPHSWFSAMALILLHPIPHVDYRIKQVDNLAKQTAENPNESLLAELRVLEKKMGLVLTLVSVGEKSGDDGLETIARVCRCLIPIMEMDIWRRDLDDELTLFSRKI